MHGFDYTHKATYCRKDHIDYEARKLTWRTRTYMTLRELKEIVAMVSAVAKPHEYISLGDREFELSYCKEDQENIVPIPNFDDDEE